MQSLPFDLTLLHAHMQCVQHTLVIAFTLRLWVQRHGEVMQHLAEDLIAIAQLSINFLTAPLARMKIIQHGVHEHAIRNVAVGQEAAFYFLIGAHDDADDATIDLDS